MPVGEAIARCDELRQANRDDRVLDAVIIRCLAELSAMAGRFDEARHYDRRSSRVLDQANMRTPTRVSQVIASSTRELARRPRRRRAGAEGEVALHARHRRRDARRAGDGNSLPPCRLLLRRAAAGSTPRSALPCIEALPRRMTSRPLVSTLAVEARLAAHHGDLDEGVALAQRAVELARTTDALNWSRPHLARSCRGAAGGRPRGRGGRRRRRGARAVRAEGKRRARPNACVRAFPARDAGATWTGRTRPGARDPAGVCTPVTLALTAAYLTEW